MEGTQASAIREALDQLTQTEEVLGSALVGFDGMVIADSFVVEVNQEKIGALVSSVYNSARRVFEELRQGKVKQAWFETERYGFLLHETSVGLLFAVARRDAPLGLVRLAMRRAVERIAAGGQ